MIFPIKFDQKCWILFLKAKKSDYIHKVRLPKMKVWFFFFTFCTYVMRKNGSYSIHKQAKSDSILPHWSNLIWNQYTSIQCNEERKKERKKEKRKSFHRKKMSHSYTYQKGNICKKFMEFKNSLNHIALIL